MSSAIKLIHCGSACLTGIVILVLAVAISAMQHSPMGVALGFLALTFGYATAVGAVSETSGRGVLVLALICWAVSLAAIVTAIRSFT